MTVNDMLEQTDELSFEHTLASDRRVQDEFDRLNRLLEQIEVSPLPETGDELDSEPNADPSWHINDYEVSRWRIVVKGHTRLDRIAHFRSELQRREDIIDARVERFDGGEIAIRLVTTGGIPMGPLERAVWSLTRNSAQITQTD